MPEVEPTRSFLSLLVDGGTLILRDDSPHELITGSAAQLHRVSQAPRRFTSREAFDAFADPNHEKLFMSIRVAPTRRPDEQWLVLEHATRALPCRRTQVLLVLASHQTAWRVRQLATLTRNPTQGGARRHGDHSRAIENRSRHVCREVPAAAWRRSHRRAARIADTCHHHRQTRARRLAVAVSRWAQAVARVDTLRRA